MRVLHIIGSLEPGGAERLLVDLAMRQARDGHEVQVLTILGGGALEPVLTQSGVAVRVGARPGGAMGVARAIVGLLAAIHKERLGVIHCWMYHAGVAGLLASRNRGRVIIGVHHDDPADPALGKTRYVARILGYLSRCAGAVAYVSESAKGRHELAGWPSGRGSVVPGGVDSSLFVIPADSVRLATRTRVDPHSTPHSKVVIWLGRNHPDKDPLTMIRAFAIAHCRDDRLRLWMVGRGFELESHAAERLASELGVATSVVFVGPTDSPATVLSGGDLIASSSKTESFGLAILEGMLCGLTPAATKTGIAAEILEPGSLAEPGNPQSLAQVILRAAGNHAPQANRAKAQHFDIEVMTSTFETLYRRPNRPRT